MSSKLSSLTLMFITSLAPATGHIPTRSCMNHKLRRSSLPKTTLPSFKDRSSNMDNIAFPCSHPALLETRSWITLIVLTSKLLCTFLQASKLGSSVLTALIWATIETLKVRSGSMRLLPAATRCCTTQATLMAQYPLSARRTGLTVFNGMSRSSGVHTN